MSDAAGDQLNDQHHVNDQHDLNLNDLPEQMRIRAEKLDRLRAAGTDPYPVGYPRTTSLTALRARFGDLAPDSATGETVGVTGRVVLNRPTGKLVFATLQENGERLQVMLPADVVGRERLDAWKSDVDLGDHVGITGEVITSRRGELSVRASGWTLTAKSLRPLPDKHKGLSDPEARVRQRYLDLIVNPEARRQVIARDSVLAALRSGLREHDYVEVETPVLQPLHGGAAARPFITHSNALDVDLYLRIALELYLKRLVVGGIERVYEIGRNFRNEGVDSSHNPEFTMLEFYEAYGDYDSMADRTRTLVLAAAEAVGGTTVPDGRGGSLDLAAPWASKTVHEAVSEVTGTEVGAVTADTPVGELRRVAAAADVALQPGWNAGQVLLELYEQLVEGQTREPTFYRDFPVEVSPLVRAHRRDPRLTERWDLVVLGRELGTGYSELVDPVEQRRRLTDQSRLAAGGDDEAMQLDEEFLRALEYAMPPTGGVGVGIDRLLMLVTGANSIRETVTFPLVRH
ncbi:MAG TPA: bifunctional lysylphosphatidylglycerol synthetase/lysine--tRNA ligase LysX [Frankiaceae bacterium]|nr:bifunctional lysylphosphatidylglycerol synthetase/lysine--tRNA ligase LysX [Frankiaceae bacterium]